MPNPKWRETQHLYKRDARQLRLFAEDILKDIDAFERNSKKGHDDQLRVALLDVAVVEMMRVVKRMRRRWEKAHP